MFASADKFDQLQAFLDKRISGLWYLNTFSMGFISVLNILLSTLLSNQPWNLAEFSTPKVSYICLPGTYYYSLSHTYFCIDDAGHTTRSLKCAKCPANTYSPYPDMSECLPCNAGTFSSPGSSECKPCIEDDPESNSNSFCLGYFQAIVEKRKKLYMSILIPIFLVLLIALLAFLIWLYQKKKKSASDISDETWLLSYKRLKRPSLPHLSSSSVETPPNSYGYDELSTSYVMIDAKSPLSPYINNQQQLNLQQQLPLQQDALESGYAINTESTRSMRHDTKTYNRYIV